MAYQSYSYLGSYANLDPSAASSYKEVSTSYFFPAARLGAATSIQTSNQIAEVESRLKEGMKVVEVQPLGEGVFETIPQQQFKEINQLAKLAGAQATMHAPMIDPAGFTKQGWSEYSREHAEAQLTDAVRRAHDLNPDGNIPVTIHASAIPAGEWKKQGKKEEKEMMVVVNPESGEISAMKKETVYRPGIEEPKIYTPEKRLDMANATQWSNSLIGVADMKRHGDEMAARALSKENMTDSDLGRIDIYYQNVEQKLVSLYDVAMKGIDKNDSKTKADMAKINEAWRNNQKKMQKALNEHNYEDYILLKQSFFEKVIQDFDKIGPADRDSHFPIRTLVPVEEFAIKHASETIGNVALKAYKEFGSTAPIVSVENFMPTMAFSRGENLSNLIKESREHFVEAAVKSGMNEATARKQSAKLIGATWDVGHINLLKKSGYKDEDIRKETEKIAPFVKHTHIADNFGFEETHLPPGMGNVPVKELMKEMEKAGFKGKAIVEAGNFVAQFKTSPHPYALENLNAPIYTPQSSPSWGMARGLYSETSGSYGAMFPEQHFSMYGAGFSALPSSLGGQVPGKQSRFSGAPME